jgi:hypothetical protein
LRSSRNVNILYSLAYLAKLKAFLSMMELNNVQSWEWRKTYGDWYDEQIAELGIWVKACDREDDGVLLDSFDRVLSRLFANDVPQCILALYPEVSINRDFLKGP